MLSRKWFAVLVVAHLFVLTLLTAAVVALAVRSGVRRQAVNDKVSSPVDPAITDAEIARVHLLTTRIRVMQNNLTNAETFGFKRELVQVQDGNPPRVDYCHLDMSQGALESTGERFDLAITGEGFFHVKLKPTIGDGTGYTRNGRLMRNRDGDLIVATGDGGALIPPVNLPLSATNVAVGQDGTVTYCTPANSRTQVAGQIRLCRFLNPQALSRWDGFYTETSASGVAVVDRPGNGGMGQLIQGYLEASNVDPLKEWAEIRREQNMLALADVGR